MRGKLKITVPRRQDHLTKLIILSFTKVSKQRDRESMANAEYANVCVRCRHRKRPPMNQADGPVVNEAREQQYEYYIEVQTGRNLFSIPVHANRPKRSSDSPTFSPNP